MIKRIVIVKVVFVFSQPAPQAEFFFIRLEELSSTCDLALSNQEKMLKTVIQIK